MLLDVLLPNRCASCELPGLALCPGCRDSLIRLGPPLCGRCGAPGAWPVKRCAECSGRRLAFASARAAIVYDARARRVVQAWKERGQRRLARQAAALVVETLARPDVAALAFVPADAGRALERGHRRQRHSPTSSVDCGSCRSNHWSGERARSSVSVGSG